MNTSLGPAVSFLFFLQEEKDKTPIIAIIMMLKSVFVFISVHYKMNVKNLTTETIDTSITIEVNDFTSKNPILLSRSELHLKIPFFLYYWT